MAYREVALNGNLTEAQQSDFLKDLWGRNPDNIADYDHYFNWLRRRIEIYHNPWLPPKFHVVTYGGLIMLIRFVKPRMDAPCDAIVDALRSHASWGPPRVHIQVEEHAIYRDFQSAVEFTISVWSMVSLGRSIVFPGVTPWLWPPNESLNTTIARYLAGSGGNQFQIYDPPAPNPTPLEPPVELPEPPDVPEPPPVWQFNRFRYRMTQDDAVDSDYTLEFPDYFNLCGMSRLVGFQICWTDNLLDHLQLRKLEAGGFSTHVFVFHQAAALHGIAVGGPKVVQDRAKEATRTLGMLIPQNRNHQEWFRSHSKNNIDPSAARQAVCSWRVRDYTYWRQRLLRLEKEYEASSPRTFAQWWRDKRRRREWLPFWITVSGVALAVLALLLTFISTVTGGISAKQAISANQKDANSSSSVAAAVAGNGTASLPGCCLCVETLVWATATGGHTTSLVSTSSTAKTKVITEVVTTMVTVTTTVLVV